MKNSPESVCKCKLCQKLAKEYEEATERYADTGIRLTNSIVERELDIVARLRDDFRMLREECKKRRKALLLHFATHKF